MDHINEEISNKLKNAMKNYMKNTITVQKRDKSKKGNYIFGETIGQGAFAKVKLATHIFTQEKVAIKILDKSIFVDNTKDICRIQKEINILKRLRHKNIIQLYEIMESKSNLYIVMDYCEGKELFDFIIKRNKLSERRACRFFQQIINGVEYLHLQNITHRDLKPENLLLDSKENIKISDFGLSFLSKKANSLLQTPCGTPSYAPPEMLRGDKYLGIMSDIWSCGIILYTMLCGNLPCVESKEELIYQCLYNKAYDYPSNLSTSVVDLMERLLRFNPEERLTFGQIKRHPWFNLVRAQMKPGLIIGVHKIPIDENILKQVEMFGYNKEKCRKSVSENKNDQLCSIYYLIMKQFTRDGKQSISDMFSEQYDSYIRDFRNWENPSNFSDSKYKEYWPESGLNTSEIQKISAYVSPRNKDNCGVIQLYNSNCNINEQQHSNYSKSNRQDESTKNICKINPEEINNNEKISESNSLNRFNHLLINIPKIQNYDTILKQTTFTSSIKKKQEITSLYSDILNEQLLTIRSETSHSPKHENELLEESKKQYYLSKLEKKVTSLTKNINLIDSFNYSSINIIPSIAKKLIKTTIFSKYLLDKQLKVPYKDELEEKFYTLQKYKALVEIVKYTKSGIFPKKIHDWNYYTFKVFLNDEEDFIFNDSFTRANINSGFVEKIKKSIKNNQCVNLRRFTSKRSLSKKVRSRTLNNNSLIDKNRLCSSVRNRRINRFLNSPNNMFVLNSSANCSGSSSYQSIRHGSRDSSIKHPPYMSPFSSTSMDNISEDEELINTNDSCYKFSSLNRKVVNKRFVIGKTQEPYTFLDNKNDIRPRSKYQKNQKSPYRYLERLAHQRSETSLFDNLAVNNKTISSMKTNQTHGTDRRYNHGKNLQTHIYSYNSPPRGMCQRTHSNNLRQITLTSKQKHIFPLYQQIFSPKSMDDEEYYEGPVDFSCVFQSSSETLLPLLRQYFKQKDYFYNINYSRIKCSKANIHLEFELLKLKDTSMTYIRIKKNKGGSIEFANIIKGLIHSFPL